MATPSRLAIFFQMLSCPEVFRTSTHASMTFLRASAMSLVQSAEPFWILRRLISVTSEVEARRES